MEVSEIRFAQPTISQLTEYLLLDLSQLWWKIHIDFDPVIRPTRSELVSDSKRTTVLWKQSHRLLEARFGSIWSRPDRHGDDGRSIMSRRVLVGVKPLRGIWAREKGVETSVRLLLSVQSQGQTLTIPGMSG